MKKEKIIQRLANVSTREEVVDLPLMLNFLIGYFEDIILINTEGEKISPEQILEAIEASEKFAKKRSNKKSAKKSSN